MRYRAFRSLKRLRDSGIPEKAFGLSGAEVSRMA